MKGTIVTGSLIVFSDGFVWKRLSNEKPTRYGCRQKMKILSYTR